MTKENLSSIKKCVTQYLRKADLILDGEADNYDGADGARSVQVLCDICETLIEELEPKCG